MHPAGSGLLQPGTTPFLLIFPHPSTKQIEMCVCVKARKESATQGCRKLEVGKTLEVHGGMGPWLTQSTQTTLPPMVAMCCVAASVGDG